MVHNPHELKALRGVNNRLITLKKNPSPASGVSSRTEAEQAPGQNKEIALLWGDWVLDCFVNSCKRNSFVFDWFEFEVGIAGWNRRHGWKKRDAPGF